MASDTPRTDALLAEWGKKTAYSPAIEGTKLIGLAHALERDLSAARAECIEQARLNGIGAERELKLMAEIERLRREFAGVIDFAIDADEGIEFLRSWREGDTSEWPEYAAIALERRE